MPTICYEIAEGKVRRTDLYEYPSGNVLADMTDDFGEDFVQKLSPGIFAGSEDERGDTAVSLIVVDIRDKGLPKGNPDVLAQAAYDALK